MRQPVAVALAALLAVGLFAGPAVAGPSGEAAVEEALEEENADEAVETYNDNVDRVPDFVRDRFADERVLVVIERADDEDLVYTAVTDEDARVESYEEGEHDPTMKLTTDEETLREVAASEEPRSEAFDAYERGDVEVEGVGPTNTIEVETAKVGYQVVTSLGSL